MTRTVMIVVVTTVINTLFVAIGALSYDRYTLAVADSSYQRAIELHVQSDILAFEILALRQQHTTHSEERGDCELITKESIDKFKFGITLVEDLLEHALISLRTEQYRFPSRPERISHLWDEVRSASSSVIIAKTQLLQVEPKIGTTECERPASPGQAL